MAWSNIVPGFGEDRGRCVGRSSRGWTKVAFTGSTEVGPADRAGSVARF